jgi:uncharacterized SAM-binding protein YcdF (DUF218 family)
LTKIKQGIDHNQTSYHLKIFNTIGLITDLYKPWGYIPLDSGITGNASIAESDAGNSFLIDSGIDSNKIFLEKESVHTLENLKNFYHLLDNKIQKVLLVTNRYHMARSMMMAKGFKINALSCPAEDNFKYTLTNIGKIIIEAFYINFYLVGRYWAIFTNNRKILKRISIISG